MLVTPEVYRRLKEEVDLQVQLVKNGIEDEALPDLMTSLSLEIRQGAAEYTQQRLTPIRRKLRQRYGTDGEDLVSIVSEGYKWDKKNASLETLLRNLNIATQHIETIVRYHRLADSERTIFNKVSRLRALGLQLYDVYEVLTAEGYTPEAMTTALSSMQSLDETLGHDGQATLYDLVAAHHSEPDDNDYTIQLIVNGGEINAEHDSMIDALQELLRQADEGPIEATITIGDLITWEVTIDTSKLPSRTVLTEQQVKELANSEQPIVIGHQVVEENDLVALAQTSGYITRIDQGAAFSTSLPVGCHPLATTHVDDEILTLMMETQSPGSRHTLRIVEANAVRHLSVSVS